MKKSKGIILGLLFILLSVSPAYAHVVVSPNEVGAAASQTFTIGFGVEKDIPTTSIRLAIPEGLENVSPFLKEGWNIDIKKESEEEGAKVTEITWSGGSVPVGFREEFSFRAKAPASESTLIWKAYQTYQDGSVVSWDQAPNQPEKMANEEGNTSGPYSETKVINDLASSEQEEASQPAPQASLPTILSIVAVAISATALVFARKKK